MAVPGKSRPATRSKSGGSFLLGMFVGLVLGLGIALGVAFYLNRTPIPLASKTRPEGGTEASKLSTVAGLPQTAAPGAGSDKPKFDFYRILPGGEEPLTDKELKERLRAPRSAAEAGTDAAKELYFVQAGSFQNPADADNQKARLAMIGFESSIEPANLPDKGTWYRVRLGPYSKLDEIAKVRQSLSQNGIAASLIKIKEPGPAKGK